MTVRSNYAVVAVWILLATPGLTFVSAQAAATPHLLAPIVEMQAEASRQLLPMFYPRVPVVGSGALERLHSASETNALDTAAHWMGQLITAGDGVTHDEFGYAVALIGDTAVIGPTSKSVGSSWNQGAGYIFHYSGGKWSQTTELIAPDGGPEDEMGWAVAAEGSTIVVAAPHPWVNDPTPRPGRVYIYVLTDGVWTLAQEITASDAADGDYFGYSVALDGKRLIVGAPGATVGANADQGAVYIFKRDANTWVQTAKFTSEDGQADEYFGLRVALSGHIALVGDPKVTINDHLGQGEVFVFSDAPGSWQQTQKLVEAVGWKLDSFGMACSITETQALIGAPGANYLGVYQGLVYAYDVVGNQLVLTQKVTAPDAGNNWGFGYAIALYGDDMFVGATTASTAVNHGVFSVGAGYLFTYAGGQWRPRGKVLPAEVEIGTIGSMFGQTVAMDEDHLLSGAPLTSLGPPPDGSFLGAASGYTRADLSLDISSPTLVAPDQTVSSTVHVTNNATVDSPLVVVLAPAPRSSELVHVEASQGSCTETGELATCQLGEIAANGGNATVTLDAIVHAGAGSTASQGAAIALLQPPLSSSASFSIATQPEVQGLTSMTVQESTSPQPVTEHFRINGTGPLSVTVSSSNADLLSDSHLLLSDGCNVDGADCTLTLSPSAKKAGTARVTVTVEDSYGQSAKGSFSLAVKSPPGGGGGGLGLLSLSALIILILCLGRKPALSIR